jgi:hypothetical protein
VRKADLKVECDKRKFTNSNDMRYFHHISNKEKSMSGNQVKVFEAEQTREAIAFKLMKEIIFYQEAPTELRERKAMMELYRECLWSVQQPKKPDYITD